MTRLTAECLLLLLLLGCAGNPSPPPRGVPAREVSARRVMQIFQQRHLRPRTDGDGTCRALLDRASQDDSTEGRAGDLDAFAKCHDPHSAYLTSDALSRLRAEIHAPDPNARHVRGRMVEHDGTRIAVIAVPSFYLHADRSTSRDLAYVLRQLIAQGADVVLIDMRDNTGGVQSEAIEVVGLFVGAGPVAQVVNAAGTSEILRAESAPLWQGPLLVVVNAMSASMTEVVAAALQDRGRALIVGQQTHGKGIGQTLVLLSSPHGGREGAVRVTDRRFHRLDGRPLQQLGVTPDIALPAAAAVVTERDRVGALAFASISAMEFTAAQPSPSADAAPFATALSWLRTERDTAR